MFHNEHLWNSLIVKLQFDYISVTLYYQFGFFFILRKHLLPMQLFECFSVAKIVHMCEIYTLNRNAKIVNPVLCGSCKIYSAFCRIPDSPCYLRYINFADLVANPESYRINNFLWSRISCLLHVVPSTYIGQYFKLQGKSLPLYVSTISTLGTEVIYNSNFTLRIRKGSDMIWK